jgi:thiosulfate dehydrogenase
VRAWLRSYRRAAHGALALATCVSLAAFAACGDDTTDGEAPRDTTPESRGAAYFADPSLGREGNLVACIDCHQVQGDDRVGVFPGAPMPGVTSRPWFWGGQEEDLLRSVNQCLYWFMGRSEPFAPGVPEGDDIYAYLASQEAGPEVYPFTIGDVVWPGPGDATRGAIVYDDACLSCHGAKSTGEGALIPSAPIMPEGTLAAHPEPEYSADDRRLVFVEKVRHGPFLGYGGTMPPFSLDVLSDAQLADLLAYLGVP